AHADRLPAARPRNHEVRGRNREQRHLQPGSPAERGVRGIDVAVNDEERRAGRQHPERDQRKKVVDPGRDAQPERSGCRSPRCGTRSRRQRPGLSLARETPPPARTPKPAARAPRKMPSPDPTIAAGDRALIDAFLERTWSELGLADNTLASYRLDLESFARWLGAHASSLARCDREALFRYLGERGAKGGTSGKGYKARSNARLL